MSKDFSVFSWAVTILRRGSCIQAGRDKVYYPPDWNYHQEGERHDDMYYALAEDWRGRHLPYPKLPRWAKRLFLWRIRLGDRLGRPCPRRGVEFAFACPKCGQKDFFTWRNRCCQNCLTLWDENLEEIADDDSDPFSDDTPVCPSCSEWEDRLNMKIFALNASLEYLQMLCNHIEEMQVGGYRIRREPSNLSATCYRVWRVSCPNDRPGGGAEECVGEFKTLREAFDMARKAELERLGWGELAQ